MKRSILITFSALLLGFLQAEAKIDIVYPSKNEVTINSESAFFSGNTDRNARLTINSEPVELWEGTFFVHVVPLKYGENKIKIKSVLNGKEEEKTYTIKRNKPSSKQIQKKEIPYIQNTEGVLYTKTIRENATVRDGASISSNRIIDLQKGIVLYLDGKKGDFYKIQESGENEFWIHKDNIETPVTLSKRIKAKIKSQKYYSDKNYDYRKFYLSHPVIYTLKQQDNNIKLTLYGTDNKDKDNFEYIFNFDSDIAGFDCYYEDNNLIFRKAKLPEVADNTNPLKGINIFIDAGHGGSEKGTISPERVNEKDINLDIALKLIKLLEEEGANVFYSRIDDTQINLYDRVKLAKDNNAFISLSIHNNSLPYGKNPYIQHGCETHYYNENAKKLAEIITNNLANDLNIKNNGIRKSSFALNRSTNPVSVLIEVAYMIYPEEYILLKNEVFRRNVAKSIKKSLNEYILSIENSKN